MANGESGQHGPSVPKAAMEAKERDTASATTRSRATAAPTVRETRKRKRAAIRMRVQVRKCLAAFNIKLGKLAPQTGMRRELICCRNSHHPLPRHWSPLTIKCTRLVVSPRTMSRRISVFGYQSFVIKCLMILISCALVVLVENQKIQ